MHAFSSTNFIFLILFGKNLDTFVMDFSRDRRKTPSDLENLLGHTYPFIIVTVYMLAYAIYNFVRFTKTN